MKVLKALIWVVLMLFTTLTSIFFGATTGIDTYPLGGRLHICGIFNFRGNTHEIIFAKVNGIASDSPSTRLIPSHFLTRDDSVSKERMESVDVVERYPKFLLVRTSDRITGEYRYYIVDKACESPSVDWADDLSVYIFSTDDSIRFLRRCEELGMTDSYWHKNGKRDGKE